MKDPHVDRLKDQCEANRMYQELHATDKGAHMQERRQWRRVAINEAIANGDLSAESLELLTYEDIY